MAKFFETLINKFFDFFNFGRFITIVIPGMIAALCLAMLVSPYKGKRLAGVGFSSFATR
jgi:hypothetical protein